MKTIETNEQFNKLVDDTFETIKDHLLKQNIKAIRHTGCAYRGADNTKCAVGCLIKDEYYDPKLEGDMAVDSQAILEVVERSLDIEWSNSDYRNMFTAFLDDMQMIHDATPVNHWQWLLEKFNTETYHIKR